AEWVSDWYLANYYALPEASGINPQGPAVGTDRVVRGGSWDTRPFFVRTVHRQHFRPDVTSLDIGFRCAANYTPPTTAPTTNT
ncbi:MAG TPA: SUMF1/EgtB/PvdO family nonheme iron enzyme, partial [Aggregatilineales bacterium]|nr:SUMF1/EgtB/PvdO family nonheme iron enzyme [Aggregatilineales bacterium]